MRIRMRLLLGTLVGLVLALAVGLVPGMSMTAYADTASEPLFTFSSDNYTCVLGGPGSLSQEVTNNVGKINKIEVIIESEGAEWAQIQWGHYKQDEQGQYTIPEYSSGGITATAGVNKSVVEGPTIAGAYHADVQHKGDGKLWWAKVYYDNGESTELGTWQDVTNVTLSPANTTLTVEDAIALTATVEPENATVNKVTWSVTGDAVTLYSDEACKTTVPLGTATSTLTVYARGASAGTATVTCASNADATKSAICSVTVNKADPTANAPTGLTATYGQTLADVSLEGKNPEGNTEGTWAWDDGAQSVGDVVSPAATFPASFTPKDTAKYNSVSVPVAVTVNKAEATIKAKDQSIFVGGAVPDLGNPVQDTHYTVTGLVGGDTLPAPPSMYYVKDGAKVTPDASKAGEYNIVCTGTGTTGNYLFTFFGGKLTISEKPLATVAKAPKAKTLTYNGSAQELISAGEATGGTMAYSLDGKEYSEAIPTGTDAKAYTVWYKVVGDANHNDTEAQSVTSTITKKDEPTPTPEPTPAPTVAKAAKPKTVAYVSKGEVAVSWKAAKGAKSYQLQWRKAGAKKWTTASVKGKSKTVTGLKAGACYEFRVRGVNGKARGKWSSASLRWLKGAAKAKAAAGKSTGSVKATWKADKAATGGFKVFVYSKRGGKAVKTKVVKAGATSATVKGLKSGKTYYVRVRPYRAQGGSTYYGAISGYRAAKAK